MILFLNFTPIEFMGGTEKWMNNTAKKVSRYETPQMLSITPRIANYYGMHVLGKKYDSHAKKIEMKNHSSLDFSSFVPFTKKWVSAKEKLSTSRIIYTRYEILELLIILYFLGLPGFRKTIMGVHSPFIYKDPLSFFDNLHNKLYGSKLYKYILKKTKKVHVLNKSDENYFKKSFKLNNVVYVPNGMETTNTMDEKESDSGNQLNVLFVGELSLRKGIDLLIDIIKKSSVNTKFTITGDGPLKKDIEELEEKFSNVKYMGYSNKNELDKLYLENDVLILPSRAESMSLALLEAMSHGLAIINSSDTSLGLDEKIEYSCDNKNINTYLEILEKLLISKKTHKLNKTYAKNYFEKNFSSKIIDPKLLKYVFGLK